MCAVTTRDGELVVLKQVRRTHTYQVTQWRTGYVVTLAWVQAVNQRAACVLVARYKLSTLLLRGLTGQP